jgi:hypothetical protein
MSQISCRSSDGADTPAEALRVIVSGDTQGWLVPCGCSSKQSGGLLRRGSYVQTLKDHGPVVLVDVGGAVRGTSAYDRLKFQAILDGEAAMGYVAHNIGAAELALGVPFLRETMADASVPLISANVFDQAGERVGQQSIVVKRGQSTLAIVGVVSPRFAHDGVMIQPADEAVLAAIDDLNDTFDTLIVLAYVTDDELAPLAASLPEADAIIGGPTGQPLKPSRSGPTLISSATNKGKFLVELSRPLTEDSANWDAEIVSIDGRFDDHPAQEANLQQYLQALASRNFRAEDTQLGPQLSEEVPETYRVAGTSTCLECHVTSGKVWKESHHAQAWASLEVSGKHVDPSCQLCHVTGYGLPGGFSSHLYSQQDVNVGCESCHGPSKAHVDDPSVPTPWDAADECVRCHDAENSPRFEYDIYWHEIEHFLDPGQVAWREAGHTWRGG